MTAEAEEEPMSLSVRRFGLEAAAIFVPRLVSPKNSSFHQWNWLSAFVQRHWRWRPAECCSKYESAFRTIASNPSKVPQWLISQLQFDSLLKFSDPCSLRKGLSLSSKRAVATSDTSFEGMPSCNTNAPAHLDGRPLPLGLKVSHDAQASCIHPQLGGPPAMHVLLVRILLLDSPPRLNGKIFKGSN